MAKPNAANLSAEELLAAVGQLSPPELDRFMLQVIALSARLKAGSLPRDEANLLHGAAQEHDGAGAPATGIAG